MPDVLKKEVTLHLTVQRDLCFDRKGRLSDVHAREPVLTKHARCNIYSNPHIPLFVQYFSRKPRAAADIEEESRFVRR